MAVEYVPVDAIGNIGSAYTVNRDVVAVDAGPNAPVASVLQVGSKVLSEVVTADDGSKSFDDEAVFVAIMLHDMGLTDGHRLNGGKQQCFTIVGARMAQELARKHEWTERRAGMAANAITLHLNVIVDPHHGREAELVRAGSGADVAGLGIDVLYTEQIQSVCDKHPRGEFKACVLGALGIEATERPGSRVAFMNKSLGFDKLVAGTTAFGDC